mgnify:CR=1 FL=1
MMTVIDDVPLHLIRYPMAPLIDYLNTSDIVSGRVHVQDNDKVVPSAADYARECGVTPRTWKRWVSQGGVPDSKADRLAVTLGHHASRIWPEWLMNSARLPAE